MSEEQFERSTLLRALHAYTERQLQSGALGAVEGLSLGDASMSSAAIEPGCERCPFAGREDPIAPEGPVDASLLVVVDVANVSDAQQRSPMTGPARAMFDKMMEKVVGVDLKDIRVVNAVRCAGASGKKSAVEACATKLRGERQAHPSAVVLAMGGAALAAIEGVDAKITERRGVWSQVDDAWLLPTFHPRYLLKAPGKKRLVFNDLQSVRDKLKEG